MISQHPQSDQHAQPARHRSEFASKVFLTELDLVRRVDEVIDKAIKNHDAAVLRRVAILLEADIKISTGRTSIGFKQDARLFDAARWFIRQYHDLIVSSRLVARCINNPPVDLVNTSCQRALVAFGFEPSRPTRYANTQLKYGMAEVCISFEFTGDSLAQAYQRLVRYVRMLASERYSQAPQSAWSPMVKQRRFLAELIDSVTTAGFEMGPQEKFTVDSAPTSYSHAHSRVPFEASSHPDQGGVSLESGNAFQHTKLAVPDDRVPGFSSDQPISRDVSEALSKRVELLRRRTGAACAPLSATQHAAVCRLLAETLSAGDPLDAAALSLILYDAGLSLRMDRFVNTPFEIAVPVADQRQEHRPNSSTPKAPPATPPAPSSAGLRPSSREVPVPSTQDYDHRELLTTDELSARIKYDSRTIRDHLRPKVFVEGLHYVRPFGGRKILYKWGPIAQMMGLDPSLGASGDARHDAGAQEGFLQ